MAASIGSHFENIKSQYLQNISMQFASKCAVFQILLDKIHLYFCDPFPLIVLIECLGLKMANLWKVDQHYVWQNWGRLGGGRENVRRQLYMINGDFPMMFIYWSREGQYVKMHWAFLIMDH